jgi:hypothetical protein
MNTAHASQISRRKSSRVYLLRAIPALSFRVTAISETDTATHPNRQGFANRGCRKTALAPQRRIQNHGKQDASAELIQMMRMLSRSYRRFTEDHKVKVFRSLIKETRITANDVEFEMYVQPTRNVWWKYRQKSAHKQDSRQGQTVRVGIPQSARPEPSIYTTSQAAKILGISSALLRWRIKVGKYPAPPRVNGQRPLFTTEHVQKMRSTR